MALVVRSFLCWFSIGHQTGFHCPSSSPRPGELWLSLPVLQAVSSHYKLPPPPHSCPRRHNGINILQESAERPIRVDVHDISESCTRGRGVCTVIMLLGADGSERRFREYDSWLGAEMTLKTMEMDGPVTSNT